MRAMERLPEHRALAARFLRARLGTVLAIVPLGVWTVLHLWNNLGAFAGAEEWERRVVHYSSPLSQALVLALVLGPLLYHTLWGLGRIGISRPNNLAYREYANLKFLLQRLSALGVLLFLGAHLWLALLKPRLVEGHAEHFAELAREMRFHGPTLVVYLLGTLGVSYHLANGLETALMKLGMRWPRRASGDRLEQSFLLLFFVLLAMSWGAIYALWRAGDARPTLLG
jgi:succinate dehydrogenase / fumarate reductase cytochrome b subunit